MWAKTLLEKNSVKKLVDTPRREYDVKDMSVPLL